MGSFGEGFAQGFFNTLSDNMEVRKTEARDYFNKQVDIARTAGVANRNRVNAAVNESVTIARQLEAMGVPKDIIMAQANMDPASLSILYDQVTKMRSASAVPLDEKAYRSVFELSGDYAAPDEDFATFFSKMFNPIVEATNNDPEGFKSNPKGTIWANAFGFNQMDRARAKLAETEVAPGLTAEQAIAYGDTITPNRPNGNSTVTVNPQAVNKLAGVDTISPGEAAAISKEFDAMVPEIVRKMNAGNGNTAIASPEMEQAAQQEAFAVLMGAYNNDPKFADYLTKKYQLGMPAESAGEPATAPVDPAATPMAETPSEAPVVPPEPPSGAMPLPEDYIAKFKTLRPGFNLRDNGDGTTDVIKPDGSSETFPNDVVKQLVDELY